MTRSDCGHHIVAAAAAAAATCMDYYSCTQQDSVHLTYMPRYHVGVYTLTNTAIAAVQTRVLTSGAPV